MSEYIVSARKYRPDSFGALVGQENIARTLKNSISRGQLAHAYLFCGPRGVGKTTVARIFAKIINCYNPSTDLEPCCRCESCVSFQEGRSYCIHELDAASNNSVDDIRMLIDQVNIPPQTGKYSVYIIDEVHMLSTAAFNAFLKTLEEPPAHAIFILATTEKHKILPTILSRCQTYDFNRISVPQISARIREIASREGVTIDDESIHVMALKADGAMRDALTIFDQTVAFCGTEVKYSDVVRNLNMLDYDNCFSIVDNFLAGDYASALLKFNEILSKGFNALYFVTALSSHLRDLIVAGSGGLDSLLELPDSLRARYKEQSSRCSLRFLYDALGITTQCEAGYKTSVNPRLHIEFALMRLSFLSGASASAVKPSATSLASPAGQVASAPQETPVSQSMPGSHEPTSTPQDTRALHVSQTTPSSSRTTPADLAPVRRRSGSRASSALSIPQTAAPAGQPTAPALTPIADKVPDEDLIRDKWREIASEYSNKPRLASAMTAFSLEIREEDGKKIVLFSVSNTAQKEWIEDKLLKVLETKLRTLTGSSAVRLLVDLAKVEEVTKPIYTKKEKAKQLMENNPEVRNLVKDLDLDI